jgi:hypothetical protein
MIITELEKHILHNIELTDSQKKVLAKTVEAGGIDKPVRVSLEDEKLVSARDALDDLDIISYSYKDNTITINSDSIELMKMEGIIDDSEQLTPEGTTFATGEVKEHQTFLSFLNSDLLFLND